LAFFFRDPTWFVTGARLQDELMALRMYHEELLGERRWLKNAEKNHQAAQAQADPGKV